MGYLSKKEVENLISYIENTITSDRKTIVIKFSSNGISTDVRIGKTSEEIQVETNSIIDWENYNY